MARTLPDHPAFTPLSERHPMRHFFVGLAALLVLAAAGYVTYTWQHNAVVKADAQASTLQAQIAALQQKTQTQNQANQVAAAKTVSLLQGRVTLTLPEDWTKATAPKLLDACTGTASGTAECEAVSTIVPKVYNSNASHFKTSIKVFKNLKNLSAKTWFEQVYKGGLPRPAEGDQTAVQPINGNDGYYFLQNVPGSYKDLFYVVTAHGHAVVMYTRVYEVNTDAKGVIDDFTQYLPVLKTTIDTLQIKE